MRDTATELARRGHSIEVITARHPDGLLTEQRDGVTWHYATSDASRPRRPGRNPQWLAEARRVFIVRHRERPFDIVQSESTSGRSITAYCEAHQVPVVIRFHGNYLGFMRAVVNSITRATAAAAVVADIKTAIWATAEFAANRGDLRAFHNCPTVIPSRQQVRDTRVSHFITRSKISVVPNGIDISRFKPRSCDAARHELDLNPLKYMFIAVGRLNRDKGFDTAIHAFARLPSKILDRVQLVIVGDGPERGALSNLAARLGVAEQVTFVGDQPPERIPTWLNAADMFLFPTHRDEAAPLVLLQALASELPVIATASGSIPEVIDQPGQNGIVVKPADPNAFAEAMLVLYNDHDLAASMAQAGRRRALQRYTVQTMVDGLLDVYAPLVLK